jgi:hypothetical protein
LFSNYQFPLRVMSSALALEVCHICYVGTLEPAFIVGNKTLYLHKWGK